MNESITDIGGYSEKAVGILGQISEWVKSKFSSLIVLYFSSKITNKIVKVLIWVVSIILLASGVYQILGGGN